MTNPISFQILLLAGVLTALWGVYFVWTVTEWAGVMAVRKAKTRGEVVVSFRRMVTAWCLFVLPASVVVRLVLVEMGYGDAIIGQVAFFALAGSNLVGAVFAVVSLRLD